MKPPGGASEWLQAFTTAWCLLICLQTIINGSEMVRFVFQRPADFRPPSFAGLWRPPVLPPWQAIACGASFCASMGAAAWAADPRPFLAIALVTYILFFAQVFFLDFVGRKTNTVPFIIVALLLGHTQVGGAPLVDAVVVVQAVVAIVYWMTGVQKLRIGGLRWIDGRTLRVHLQEHAMWDDRRIALRLAAAPRLCAALSVATLLFELSFPIALFIPESVPLVLGLGVLFHAGIEICMGISYWKYLCPGYLAFLIPWLGSTPLGSSLMGL